MAMGDPLREVHAWRVHSTQHKCIPGSVRHVSLLGVIRRVPGGAVELRSSPGLVPLVHMDLQSASKCWHWKQHSICMTHQLGQGLSPLCPISVSYLPGRVGCPWFGKRCSALA